MSALNKVQAGAAAQVGPVQQQEKNPHNDEVMFSVRDTTATEGQRTHVMLDQNKRKIPFVFHNSFTPIPIPYRFAIQFARIEEFEVMDSNGRRWKTVPITKEKSGFRLDRDEVVAKLEELTQDALLARAASAGGNFKKNSTKAEMVAFLTAMSGLRIVTSDDAQPESVPAAQESEEAAAAVDLELEDTE